MKAIFLFELKSYITNRLALFWTVVYPVAMLALLIALFDRGNVSSEFHESYRFKTTVGIVMLTIVSTALFGMGQSMSDMRAKRALVPYILLPTTTVKVVLAILLSRIVAVFLFSLLFFLGAFWWLGVAVPLNVHTVLQVFVSITAASLFSFSLVLPLLAISKNTTTIIALANIVNIYALMSAGVFIPKEVLPSWSEIFVTSSPFSHLNTVLQAAFHQVFGGVMWGLNVLLLGAAAIIIKLASTRKLLVPK